MRYYLSFLLLLAAYVAGLLLFTRGFLLKRTVVKRNSTCAPHFSDLSPLDRIGKRLYDLDALWSDPIVDSSQSAHLHDRSTHSPAAEEGCWMPRRYKRAVVVIIDALRFDFVAPTPEPSGSLFANRLPALTAALAELPRNARLYRFVADAPTTTLQRLKGMTTGSLPTFVDAGENFASTEITEDNLIDRLIDTGSSLTFLGDDTWTSLFPRRFVRAHPFPSFNVKDLHSVDRGVMDLLGGEVGREGWGVIVAHLLGVDHCGHTHGPNTTVMREKLDQMNDMLSALMSLIADDTVLLVMGDHGMTRTGDHGGDSEDEVNSALFVYSKTPLTRSQPLPQGQYQTISQIDLVPTLSLLLGAPIPFSNLGAVIPDLFDIPGGAGAASSSAGGVDPASRQEVDGLRSVVRALHLNALQVRRYVEAYSLVQSADLPLGSLHRLNTLLSSAWAQHQSNLNTTQRREARDLYMSQLRAARDLYAEYLSGVRAMCQTVWARFDLISMAAGALICVTAIIIHTSMFSADPIVEVSRFVGISGDGGEDGFNRVRIVLFGAIAAIAIVVVFSVLRSSVFYSVLASIALVLYLFAFVACLRSIFHRRRLIWRAFLPSHLDRFAVVLWAVYSAAMLSNSFVVREDSTSAYLLCSLVLVAGVATSSLPAGVAASANAEFRRGIVRQGGRPEQNVKQEVRLNRVAIASTAVILVCIRASNFFRGCREERTPCEISFFVQSIASLPEEHRLIRVAVGTAAIFMIVWGSRRWLRHHGNFNGNSSAVIAAAYLTPLMAAGVAAYWCILGLPERLTGGAGAARVRELFGIVAARVVYLVGGLVGVIVASNPLCLYILRRKNSVDELKEKVLIETYKSDFTVEC